jgi:ketosteroid isomerase-like protein
MLRVGRRNERVCARADVREATQSAEERRVLATEDEYVAAEVARDEAALRRLVDDRFVLNRNDGTTFGKEELIQSVLNMRMAGQTIRERSLLIEGDIARVFGTSELRTTRATGQEAISTLRYIATCVRRSGSWRVLALQMQPRATE